jgi:hypothetical protein
MEAAAGSMGQSTVSCRIFFDEGCRKDDKKTSKHESVDETLYQQLLS